MPDVSPLKHHIVDYLRKRQATYARPVCSREIAKTLNICETYARQQARELVLLGLARVRAGPHGGYYLDAPAAGDPAHGSEGVDRTPPRSHTCP